MDYFMSWTLRCSQNKYKDIDEKVNSYSKMILSKILFNDNNKLNHEKIISVKCGKNCPANNGYIDLWCEIEIENYDKIFVIIFENKGYTKIRLDQLINYQNFIENYYINENHQINYIMMRGDDLIQDDFEKCKNSNFKPLSINDLMEIFETLEPTGNALFDEFWYHWYWNKDIEEKSSKIIEEIFENRKNGI